MNKLFFISIPLFMILIASSLSFTPPDDFNGRGVRSIYNVTDVNSTRFCVSGWCFSSGNQINGSGSGGVTYSHLSNFTDDLGDRGYNDLANFSNSPGYLTDANDTVQGSELESLFSTTVGLLYRSGVNTFGSIALGNTFQVSGGIFQLISGSIKSSHLNLTDITLADFTDDLGDRGYNSLSNFTDDLGSRGYTHLSNFTDDIGVSADYDSLSDLQSAVSNDFHNLGGTDDDNPEAGDVQWSDLTDQGSFTDTKYCTYSSGTGYISCTADGGSAGFTNGSVISVSGLVLENPLSECNINNTFMTQYAGNQTVCRELNQSIINTASLNNDAGFITATLTQEQVEDYVGGMVTGNTETGITVTYQDADGTIDFVVTATGGGNTTEEIQDAAGAMADVGIIYNDGDNTLNFDCSDVAGNQLSCSGLETIGVSATPTFTTLSTGQGQYELYAMNQNVRTTDAPTFATINTGFGNNELYIMNQNVRSSDPVTFANVTFSGGGSIGDNSTCLILNSPGGTAIVEVCD